MQEILKRCKTSQERITSHHFEGVSIVYTLKPKFLWKGTVTYDTCLLAERVVASQEECLNIVGFPGTLVVTVFCSFLY